MQAPPHPAPAAPHPAPRFETGDDGLPIRTPSVDAPVEQAAAGNTGTRPATRTFVRVFSSVFLSFGLVFCAFALVAVNNEAHAVFVRATVTDVTPDRGSRSWVGIAYTTQEGERLTGEFPSRDTHHVGDQFTVGCSAASPTILVGLPGRAPASMVVWFSTGALIGGLILFVHAWFRMPSTRGTREHSARAALGSGRGETVAGSRVTVAAPGATSTVRR